MSVVLSDHLPLLATAPDGIKKLRGLILELAVRGKLVPQAPDDEPASELLKRIAEERVRLEAEGLCKKSKPLPPVSCDEQPFALPSNWVWVRLPDVYFSISPSSNKLLSSAIQETGTVPVVDQGKRYIAGYTDQISMLIKLPGPVVIFGDHTTERKYVDFDFVAGADGVKILRPILQYEKFFFRQLQGFKLEERGYARHFKVLNDQLYALPPLAEQHRIVAKVDELMALCDRLEAEQSDSDTSHARLVETLLGTLVQSADAEGLGASWQLLVGHFDTLFATDASLNALKQTILQLAVMGGLVPQETNCFDCAALSDGIVLPTGWRLEQIEKFCNVQGGIQKTPLRRPLKNHFPYLRVANVQRGNINIDELARYELTQEELARWSLNAGDLLIVEGNGSESEIGRCAIWNAQVADCVYQNHLIRVRPHVSEQVDYLQLFLNSPVGVCHMKRLV